MSEAPKTVREVALIVREAQMVVWGAPKVLQMSRTIQEAPWLEPRYHRKEQEPYSTVAEMTRMPLLSQSLEGLVYVGVDVNKGQTMRQINSADRA